MATHLAHWAGCNWGQSLGGPLGLPALAMQEWVCHGVLSLIGWVGEAMLMTADHIVKAVRFLTEASQNSWECHSDSKVILKLPMSCLCVWHTDVGAPATILDMHIPPSDLLFPFMYLQCLAVCFLWR